MYTTLSQATWKSTHVSHIVHRPTYTLLQLSTPAVTPTFVFYDPSIRDPDSPFIPK